MNILFQDATEFNGAIGSWDVGQVTDMYGMFVRSRAFNRDIASWDVRKVTTMTYMFHGAEAFNNCSKKTLAVEWAENSEFMSSFGNSWATLDGGTWVHAGRICYSICLSLSIY